MNTTHAEVSAVDLPSNGACWYTRLYRSSKLPDQPERGGGVVGPGGLETPQSLLRAKLRASRPAALLSTDPTHLVSYTGCNHPGKRRSANKDWSDSYCTQDESWDDPKRNPELYERFKTSSM